MESVEVGVENLGSIPMPWSTRQTRAMGLSPGSFLHSCRQDCRYKWSGGEEVASSWAAVPPIDPCSSSALREPAVIVLRQWWLWVKIMVMIQVGNQISGDASTLCLLWLLSMRANFICQFGWAAVPRYLIEHYSEYFSEGVFE